MMGSWTKIDYSNPNTLPGENRIVLIRQVFSRMKHEEAAEVTIGRWNGQFWEWQYYRPDFRHGTIMDNGIICPGNEYVTHWTPLPMLPETKGENANG